MRKRGREGGREEGREGGEREGGSVTLWMVPPQTRSPRTVCSRIIGPPDQIL